jgi:hypothetical protein
MQPPTELTRIAERTVPFPSVKRRETDVQSPETLGHHVVAPHPASCPDRYKYLDRGSDGTEDMTSFGRDVRCRMHRPEQMQLPMKGLTIGFLCRGSKVTDFIIRYLQHVGWH